MIALGCDHGGFELKEILKKHLEESGTEYKDFGAYSKESIDYAPIAEQVAEFVAGGKAEKGVLVCSTGIGVSIAANKVKGIRAGLCTNELCAELTRKHNNANILCMGGLVVDAETAVSMLKIFLTTEFEGGRHQRRIDEISAIEQRQK